MNPYKAIQPRLWAGRRRGAGGGLRPLLYVKGVQKFLLGFAAMDPEVQRLVIGQLLVIVVPVGILWFVWIRMLEK